VPSWDDVVAAGLELPGVEVGTSYRTPALKVRGKGMCRLRDDDPDVLVMRVIHMGEKEALRQEDPETFFTTPHYDGYPYILIRLSRVDEAELRELLEEAWRIRAPKRLIAEYDAR
jgi:hypothetical protein